MQHDHLDGAGQIKHHRIDRLLPDETEKGKLRNLRSAPKSVSGARDNPEAALANLLSQLAALGLINDNTTAS
jgi:hypothetical protein